ncbi:MAG: DUF1540 domain-containing protein [Epulopiscium sp.]|nr:DUF1540 domain-containing protein [Candidatus Epulonipiscium sp.]
MNRPEDQKIHCSVKSCQYNDQVKYCTLDSIQIGPNGSHAKSKEETDCLSFEVETQ